ncbi:helix-turn-helix domain-containing protein [Corynebacterium argentoratense]|uniref:helix-turn-helix domain-containing protein n=1 Tax=Corynebacterium argentoratense TaxID=42817 RepID=UPI0022863B25
MAKKAGKYKGRQRALTTEQSNEIRKQAKAGARPTELAKAFGVSRSTIYRELQKEANT